MFTNSIPPSVAEATNGALMLLSAISMVFFCMYLERAWKDRDRGLRSRFFTYENKTAFGLAIMFAGLAIKCGSAWWALHLFTRGKPAVFPLLSNITVTGTLLAIFGAVVTMRALWRYRWSRWTLAWLAFGSIIFSIAFAVF